MIRPASCPVRAFTLVELLTVIAVIAILAAILLVTLNKVRSSADRASTITSLRTTGLAIATYSADEGRGRLPGNLNIGQPPVYSTHNPRYLGTLLWRYLGDPEPTGTARVSPALTNRAYERQRTASGMGIDTFVYMVPTSIGSSSNGTLLPNPFGNPENANQEPYPVPVARLAEYNLSKTWALREVDRGLRSGSNYLPEPALGNVRMHLYFDWHVAPVAVQ